MVAIDPRRLLTFGAVARRRSFSLAARELSLSQPAVSQQVAGLERQLGTRLLDRGRGGPTLTATGALLLEHAEAVAAQLGLASVQVAELAAAEAASLRLGAFPSALATLVPAAIARLRDSDADVRVTVHEGGAEELANRVRDGRLHLAVVFRDADLPPLDDPAIERIDLLEEPFLAALGPDHPLAGRDELRLIELRDDPWTAPSPDHLLARACRAAGFSPRIGYITRDPMAIRALVAAGLAVTLAPRLLAGALPGVRFVALSGTQPRRRVSVLLPAKGVRPPARRFLAALDAAAAGSQLSECSARSGPGPLGPPGRRCPRSAP